MGELVDNGLLDEYGRNPHGWDGLQALEIFTNWKAGGRCPTCGVVFKRSGTVHIEA
jgi:hypothetical protein